MTESPAMTEATYLHATQTAYDTVAADYERLLRSALDTMPLDRAMLAAFAETVRADPALSARPVADLGCGPGQVTAHLRSLGLATAFGIDLSAEMVAVARKAHPDIRFEQGSMTGLDLTDGVLGGALAWYSTVHTPPELLPKVFTEIHRVLAPGGPLLLAFKAGDRLNHLKHAYGHDLSLDVYWRDPDRVAKLLADAGLTVHARLIREPDERERPTQGRQAYLLAHKAAGDEGPADGA